MAVAIWAGLMTGLVESLWLWFNQSFRGRVIFTSDYILWMTPLLYAMLFAGVALGVALLAAILYPRFRLAFAVFLFGALGVGCLFIPVTQIARWAALLVVIGAAFQMARLASRRPTTFARIARRSLGALGALAIGAHTFALFSRDSPSPGEVARADLPNVVLIVWDTVRSTNLSLYGYGEPTTTGLERLAANAVVFDHAVAPSPWTLPSHGSMFTGRWPHELSTGWLDRLDGAYPTLAEVLGENGYATGGFVANHHYTSYDSGLDRGFARYADYRPTYRQFLRSSWFTQTRTGAGLLRSRSLAELWRAIAGMDFWVGVKRANHRKRAEIVNDEFFAWVDGVEDRPFFGFLNYFDAHAAYWSPPGTQDRFHAEHPAIRAYDAAISYLDDQVMAVVEGLRERGQLDNTIIVVTSDHGELFGENGLNGHAHNLYHRVLHVPLLVYAPARFPENVRIDTEVSLRNLPATLLDMVGIQNATGIAGTSLSEHWRDRDPSRARPSGVPVLAEVDEGRNNDPSEPISRGPMKAILSDGLHYILNGDGVEELYDYQEDPREETDLSTDPGSQEALRRLRSALQSLSPSEGNDPTG